MDRSNPFLTETAAMRTFTFSSPRSDTSFKIGLGLVAFFAAAEMFFASYYYLGHRVSQSTSAPAPPVVAKSTPAPGVAPAATVASTVPPSIAEASPSSAALSADDRLLAEASELSSRGDTVSALNRLQQASEKDPKNAQVFAEMAKIYEAAKNFDRSNEMWRKVQEIGPSSGAIYELADAKLKRGIAATPAPAPVQAEATPASAPPSAVSAEGIPDGSTFGIAEVSATETPDNDADTNLMLRIGVKKRANTVIDHTKVKIQVFFYDTVDDRDIKLTDAEVNYEWLTPDHDWAGPKPEVLAVTYVRPKNKAKSQDAALSEAAAAVNPNKKGRPLKSSAPVDDSGRRKYLGYIVRIYYNDKLQAVRSDPTKLLNLFPPPSTASSP
jgi:tetratricopeptide (TPR) repeat protein